MVGDEKPAREGAVEVVDVVALDLRKAHDEQILRHDDRHDRDAHSCGEGLPGGESRRGADAARDPFVEARGVERQRQHGQQGRQSGQIEDGAQRETGCDAESPAAERRGQYVERFSHASIRSMRPSFTYHTYPSTSL